MTVSARYRKSRYGGSIVVSGFTPGTDHSISIGMAYSLRDALAAAIEEWEEDYRKLSESGESQ